MYWFFFSSSSAAVVSYKVDVGIGGVSDVGMTVPDTVASDRVTQTGEVSISSVDSDAGAGAVGLPSRKMNSDVSSRPKGSFNGRDMY
jgi:hypothetical protein